MYINNFTYDIIFHNRSLHFTKIFKHVKIVYTETVSPGIELGNINNLQI